MNTDRFISEFKQANPFPESSSLIAQGMDWFSYHTSVTKMLEISGMVLGSASLFFVPALYKSNKMAAVMLAVVGSLTALISYVAYKALDIVLPPHHSMETHAFTPAEFKAGRLYYQGDVPILELKSDDPYEAGMAHGYLMGAPLNELLGRLTIVKRLAGMPFADQTPETLKAIRDTLNPDHLKELEGLVDGFNQWSGEHTWFGHKLTVDELILFHLMPDSLHFAPKAHEARLTGKKAQQADPLPVLGCTAVVDQDPHEGMVFGRNMDWPSFGITGRYSLVINRKYSNDKFSTAEIGIPGFVGTLTGMNEHGLSLAINVCSGVTTSIRGMPAAFYNRCCLESCQNVKELEKFVNKENTLGSYHLTASDAQQAKSFHFYQGINNDALIVREWEVDKPLVTTNCKYAPKNHQVAHMHCSLERDRIIRKLFSDAKDQVTDQFESAKLVEASLTLPDVNNGITSHTVVMYPQSKKMKAAFDNAFSAKSTLHEIDLAALF